MNVGIPLCKWLSGIMVEIDKSVYRHGKYGSYFLLSMLDETDVIGFVIEKNSSNKSTFDLRFIVMPLYLDIDGIVVDYGIRVVPGEGGAWDLTVDGWDERLKNAVFKQVRNEIGQLRSSILVEYLNAKYGHLFLRGDMRHDFVRAISRRHATGNHEEFSRNLRSLLGYPCQYGWQKAFLSNRVAPLVALLDDADKIDMLLSDWCKMNLNRLGLV